METNPLTNPEQMPQSTSMAMPQFIDTANWASIDNSNGFVEGPLMTPASLSQPLPSIVQSAPVEVGPQCDAFTQWVADNPLLAGGMLVGLALLTWRKS